MKTQSSPPLPYRHEQIISELQALNNILLEYHSTSGRCHVVPVKEAGFVVQRADFSGHSDAKGGLVVLFDVDDTLVATSKAKKIRLQQYVELLEKNGLSTKINLANAAMSISEGFSRWEGQPGKGSIYHKNAHIAALAWITEQIESTSIEQEIDELLLEARHQLQNLHASPSTPSPTLPFYLTTTEGLLNKDSRLVIHTPLKYGVRIEKMFEQTIYSPPIYQDMIDVLTEIGEPVRQPSSVPVGILTYGAPEFQLKKVCELIKRYPQLPIAQVWLTRVRKGQFMEAMVATQAQKQLLSSDGQDSETLILGNHPHLIIMIDDSPREMDDLVRCACSSLYKTTGAVLLLVHTRRAETKNGQKNWHVVSPHISIDLNDIDLNSQSIPKSRITSILKEKWPYLALRLEMKNNGIIDYKRVHLEVSKLKRQNRL
jgi:FMN phosphatase YigB (HAD superfamily)